MRTTVTLNDEKVARAIELTGITKKTDLVRHAIDTLISLESARRLAALSGTDRTAQGAQRRRP